MTMMSRGKFEIAVELIPPYSPSLINIADRVLEFQKLGVQTVSIVSNPMSKPKLPALYIAKFIGDSFRRIVHYPCSGRSSVIFKSDMMSAVSMGVDAVLILAGDPHPECKERVVASERIAMLKHPPFDSMLIGAAASPQHINLDNLKSKKDAGADYFQTQPVFDVASLVNFVDKIGPLGLPALVGVMVPSKKSQLQALMEIPGVVISEEYLKHFAGVKEEGVFTSIAVREALKLVTVARECCAGVYLSVKPSQLKYFEEALRE